MARCPLVLANCLHCGREIVAAPRRRGLCWTDFHDLAIRRLYPAPVVVRKDRCRVCGRGKLYARGLCKECHRDPEIRAEFPPKIGAGCGPRAAREPTEAELDELIAVQLTCLPSWWNEPEPESEAEP